MKHNLLVNKVLSLLTSQLLILSITCSIACKKNDITLINTYTRPLLIKVVDYETNVPIEGIIVYYGLTEQKLQNNIVNYFPLGGGVYDTSHSYKMKITDSNGTVYFEKLNKFGKSCEWLEHIYINIDLTDEKKKYWKTMEEYFKEVGVDIDRHDITNLNKKYFGYYIYNCPYCCSPDYYLPPSFDMDILMLTDSFKKTKEEIVVKIRNYTRYDRF